MVTIGRNAHHLSSIIGVNLKGDLFTWDIKEAVLKRHKTLAGKLVRFRNVADLAATEIVDRRSSVVDEQQRLTPRRRTTSTARIARASPEIEVEKWGG